MKRIRREFFRLLVKSPDAQEFGLVPSLLELSSPTFCESSENIDPMVSGEVLSRINIEGKRSHSPILKDGDLLDGS